MASTFSGCSAELNVIVPDNSVALDGVDVFISGRDVEQFGTQNQPLATSSPYKSGSFKDVVWRMRVSQNAYDSYRQSGRSVTYTVSQYQPNRLKVEPASNTNIVVNQLCANDNTVLISGTARLIFGEMNKWVEKRTYRPIIDVCIPGITGC
ncbi:hypothetical protein RIVM261_061650 [Rivularia sp. IAM M-261]|nr:hypothetical protein RIVM261_061650 [Rivularia sp. IAM M-261]